MYIFQQLEICKYLYNYNLRINVNKFPKRKKMMPA